MTDNPSAFPRAPHVAENGMTLRDYFAAKAMQSLIAGGLIMDQFGNPMFDSSGETVSQSAYAYADAMLKARQA